MTASDCPIHGTGPLLWKRATDGFVETYDGMWWITPIYGGLTRPERYELRRKTTDGWRVVGSGSTQRECKEDAERIDKETP